METTKTPTIEDLIKAAKGPANRIDADVYLYNGPITRGLDLTCIETVAESVSRKHAILLLVTGGGSPDAAYKLSRYMQDKYEKFTVLIPGFCKSAGTLIALGAHELAFMPFGELGPLDIQLGRVDRFDAPQSGLAIQEALDTLESRARKTFDSMVSDYMEDNGGLLSFQSASHAALEFVTQLYAPMFARIDPEEVGGRSRSMRIAHYYGQRLALGSRNFPPSTLTTLAEKYPSHSFVIDQREATSLFKNVREASPAERELVAALGHLSRFPQSTELAARPGRGLLFRVLSVPELSSRKTHHDKIDPRARASRNGTAPTKNVGAAKPLAGRSRKGRASLANGASPPGKNP